MATLALLVAAIAGIAWVLRLGALAQLLSKPVLVGYITGVGMVLLSSQLTAFTGVPIAADTFLPRVVEFGRDLGAIRPTTLALALGSLTLLLALRRWAPKLPGALVAVGLATLTTVAFDLAARGEPTIGTIPAGLPGFAMPGVTGGDVVALLPVALGVALVGYSDNVLTARAVATKMGYRIDPNRELAALAAANLGAGVLQGMPVSSSASRSAVPAALGSVTSLVGIVAAGVVAATLLVAGDVLAAVPRAALAAIIVAAAFSIIDVQGLRQLWRISRSEALLALATSLTVMIVDVLVGVLVAVGLSIAIALSRLARPADAVLGARDDVAGWVSVEDPVSRTLPGLLVYRFDAPLFFLNIERFRTRVLQVLDENPGEESWVVLDLEGVSDIDASAIEGIVELLDQLARDGVQTVAIARANAHALARLRRARLLEPLGRVRVFPTINGAVAAYRTEQGRTAP